MFKRKSLVILLIPLMCTSVVWLWIDRGYYTMFNMAGVERINVKEAEALLKQDEVLLVDIRSEEEFNISRIEGAIRYTEQLETKLSKDQPVLVYCTVSVRSNRLAKTLSEKGFKEVYDLKNGLISWKNKGKQVIDEQGKPTQKIHTYSKWFAPLLRKGEAIY